MSTHEGGVHDAVDQLQIITTRRFERSEDMGMFPDKIGMIDKRNQGEFQFGHIMSAIRKATGDVQRSFGTDAGEVTEHLSYPYQKHPIQRTPEGHTHSYEYLVAYKCGRSILGLLHLYDTGDALGPGELVANPNRALIFDHYTHTVKYMHREEGSDKHMMGHFGPNDFDDAEHVFFSFVKQELDELESTPVIMGMHRYRSIRKVGSAAKYAFNWTKEVNRFRNELRTTRGSMR